MFKFNRSPMYWLVLGILWSITVLVMVSENKFVFSFSYVIIGILAVLSYVIAVFLFIKHNR